MLDAARGSIRDTLGAIRNVQQLIRSIKVGPKALASVIPDVHAACGPLLGSFRLLLATVEPEQPAAARSLDTFIAPRVAELEQALGKAARGPLNARQRLALEQALTRAAADLDSARALLELIEEAMAGSPARVELSELVRQSFKAPEDAVSRPGETSSATLSAPTSVEIRVNPRVAMSLIAVGVRLVAGREAGLAPHVAIACRADGSCGVTISRQAGTGDRLLLVTPRLIEPTLECVRAAARASAGELERSEDGGTLSFFWPPVRD